MPKRRLHLDFTYIFLNQQTCKNPHLTSWYVPIIAPFCCTTIDRYASEINKSECYNIEFGCLSYLRAVPLALGLSDTCQYTYTETTSYVNIYSFSNSQMPIMEECRTWANFTFDIHPRLNKMKWSATQEDFRPKSNECQGVCASSLTDHLHVKRQMCGY